MNEPKYMLVALALCTLAACETRVEVLRPVVGTVDASVPDAGSDPVDDAKPIDCSTCGALELCAVDHCVDPSGITMLGTGLRHGCVVLGGRLLCWGNNGSSQLGLGDDFDRYRPSRVGQSEEWLQFAGGQEHSCALRAPGALYCWGENSVGQLATGDTQPRDKPARVATATDFTRIACGGDNCCALRLNGALYCWGDNHEGNPGQGDSTSAPDVLRPKSVDRDMQFGEISVGEAHSCAITKNGALYCWGRNSDGQLGAGFESAQVREPMRVGLERGWRAVSAGQHHTCAIRGEGELYCWGTNDFFELGIGNASLDDAQIYAEPVRVGPDTDWAYVAVGWFHSCALKQSGTLFCWGRATEGQLGNGVGKPVPDPTPSAAGMRFKTIVVGSLHSCALDAEGKVYCWGSNIDGQLGVGDAMLRDRPTQLAF